MICFQIVSRATVRPKWLTLFRRFDFSLTHVDSFSIAPLKHVFFLDQRTQTFIKDLVGFGKFFKRPITSLIIVVTGCIG